MKVQLYVGNLSYTTTEADLRLLFTKAGQIASLALIKDRNTNISRGFAFVEMYGLVAAEKAISMLNSFNLGNRELEVARVPIP